MLEVNLRFIAASNDSLAKGLMHSAPLSDDEGAFFVFANSDKHSFWNKNVHYPISLGFMNDSFRLVDVGELHANQEEPCRPNTYDVKYVIELPHGYFEKNNVKIGDFIILENNKAKIVQQGKENLLTKRNR